MGDEQKKRVYDLQQNGGMFRNNPGFNNNFQHNNMNDVIGTGGTWANLGGGSSQKVANFTSLLDNKGVYPYPTQATDLTTEYYGCYDESIKWSDIEYYLEQVKILYPQLIDIDIKSEIESVFSSINGGGERRVRCKLPVPCHAESLVFVTHLIWR